MADPGTSSAVQKLRKHGEQLRSKEQGIVFNVYKYFRRNYTVNKAVNETCDATGVSHRTVYRILKRSSQGPFTTPTKKRKFLKVQRKDSRIAKYDSFVLSAIRQKVHSFYFQNIPPTLNLLLTNINSDEDLPNFSRTTLYRTLVDIGFAFEKRKNNALLTEKNELISWRHKYLRSIRKARADGLNVVYLDETWVNVGNTVTSAWRDKTISSARDAFLAGLSAGLKQPTARGPRFALVNAGGEQGFVNGAEFTFLCKKNSADAHEEVDGECFEKWFQEQLLPNVPEGTVIVMDNASYHSRRQDKIPTSKNTKKEIQEWLESKNITFEVDSLKRDLLELVNFHRTKYISYRVDIMAERKNCQVLRLPPYHCELNPIELVWAQVKHYVAMNNTRFQKNEMAALIREGYEKVTTENWQNYVEHVKKIEEGMWKADELQDDLEPFIIRLGSPSGSSATRSLTDSQGMSGVEPISDEETNTDVFK